MSDECLERLKGLLLELDREQEQLGHRLAAAQDAFTEGEHKRGVVRETMIIYSEAYGIPYDAMQLDDGLRREFAGLSTKEALIKVGSECGGVLVMTAACRLLVRAGLFRDMRNASGNVYGVVKRFPQVFERQEAGKYRLLAAKEAPDGHE